MFHFDAIRVLPRGTSGRSCDRGECRLVRARHQRSGMRKKQRSAEQPEEGQGRTTQGQRYDRLLRAAG